VFDRTRCVFSPMYHRHKLKEMKQSCCMLHFNTSLTCSPRWIKIIFFSSPGTPSAKEKYYAPLLPHSVVANELSAIFIWPLCPLPEFCTLFVLALK
jgi:hypothetical protein